LREHAEQVAEQNGWALHLDLPDEEWKLPEDASIALFRIAQEALTNAAKYAAAKNIRVLLAEEADREERGSVRLLVEDDGRGFHPADARPRSHGLAGKRPRMMGLNGTLDVISEPGRGTRVRATLPVPPEVHVAAVPLAPRGAEQAAMPGARPPGMEAATALAEAMRLQ
jgi:signal transduction histidine kinase